MKILLCMAAIGLMASPVHFEAETSDPEVSYVSEDTGDSETSEEVQETEQEPQPVAMTEEELTQFLIEYFDNIDWGEVFDHITDAEWWDAVLAGLWSFLGVNAAVILIMAINIIRKAAEKTKLYNAFTKVVREYAEETHQSEQAIMERVDKRLDAMEAAVIKKIADADKKEKAAERLAGSTSEKVAGELE